MIPFAIITGQVKKKKDRLGIVRIREGSSSFLEGLDCKNNIDIDKDIDNSIAHLSSHILEQVVHSPHEGMVFSPIIILIIVAVVIIIVDMIIAVVVIVILLSTLLTIIGIAPLASPLQFPLEKQKQEEEG